MRLREDFKSGTLSADITSTVTTIASAAFANLPVITAPDYMVIVADPLGVAGNPEKWKVTAHGSGSTSITVERNYEGSGQRAHLAGTAWKHGPVVSDFADDYINVLDYGASYLLADNSAAFNAAIAAARTDYNTGGTVKLKTILVPPPPPDAPNNSAYKFTNPINLRGKAQLRFVAVAGNSSASFVWNPVVRLENTTNSNPIVDADHQAAGLVILSGNTFENIAFYNPVATPFRGTGLVGWRFEKCAFITFADTPAFSMENAFWVSFDQCAFTQAAGSTRGAIHMGARSGMTAAADVCYLIGVRRSVINGGPIFECEFFTAGTGTNSGFFVIDNCDTENQAGDVGMFLRSVNSIPGGSTNHAWGNLAISDTQAFDPSSGSSPWTTISNDNRITGSNITLINSGCAQANTDRFRVRTSIGQGAFSGVRQFGGHQLVFHDLSATRLTNTNNAFGSGAKGTEWATQDTWGSGAPPITLFGGGNGADGVQLIGVSGEQYARHALTPGGRHWWGSGASSTPDTNLYRHAADVLATDDDFAIRGTGKGLKVKEGNGKMGTVSLAGGTATVATTAVTADSRILLTSQLDSGTPGFLRVTARTPGTSFVITSSSGSDASVVAWLIVEPA